MKVTTTILAICAFTGIMFAQDMPPQAELLCYKETLTLNGKPGGKPVPDGTVVQIYWDWDNNGPDAKDPLPVLGEQYSNANFNSFVVNGEGVGLGAGKFTSENGFFTVGGLAKPATYYLRVCLDPKTALVSDVITLKSGYQQVDIGGWKLDTVSCKEIK